MGQFQVVSAELLEHAGQIDVVSDRLATAQQAIQAVRMGAGAYGQLCQIVPDLLNGMQAAMIDGIGAAADAGHDTADALRSVAAAYESADLMAADRLRHVR